MSVQPQKAYWNKHPGEYERHSVEREVLRFMGWKTLTDLIKLAENLPTSFEDKLMFADAIGIGFATAGRISEWTPLKPDNFVEYDRYFEVREMEVHKRFKKLDHVIVCQRCKTENEKFELSCKKCSANLVYSGKKKWKTKTIEMYRIPFTIPKKEATAAYLSRRLAYAKANGNPYLFYNPKAKKPVSEKCLYDHVVEAGKEIGLEMWPHRFRAERCKQLREEYEFTKDDLRRFTMIVADRTLEIYAGTSLPYEKKMGITCFTSKEKSD
jgi:hypothetical protein